MKSSNHPSAPSAGLRRFLYLTAAITGAAILVVEILGAKMLSPFVGSSHFVWTAQIAVTLISLALGYYFGGRLVDVSPRLSRLYICIALAAIYLAITVVAVEKIAYTFLALPNMPLAAAALFSSLILFFVPLTLLAATGPFLIRVLTQSVDGIGGQVGRLSAISTVGSVFGTVLIGYVMLPFLPNSITMFLTAGVLLIVVTIYFAMWDRKEKAMIQTTAALGLLFLATLGAVTLLSNPKFKNMNRLFIGNSNFGQLQVMEVKNSSIRYYLNDYLIQNTYDASQKMSLSLFSYMLQELAWGYHGSLSNILCIGMGVGIVPNTLNAEGVKVDVVEINPAILPVAREFFGFKSDGMNITIGDGRFFINKSQKKYDAIALDAFLGESSPSHLMTREAFTEMSRLLGEKGVLVINSFGDFQPGRDFFVASLDKTLKAVFKNVHIHTAGQGNVFFAASQGPLDLKPRPNVRLPNRVGLETQYFTALQVAPPPNPASGRVLTDDYNPVEFYDAANRERFRRTLAAMARDL